ncbi:hypothetical protein ONZ45_g1590 [Pleurotus djamor]|nr:hypothetical protein ONZ45_g1590 [Pleurotus djamor]
MPPKPRPLSKAGNAAPLNEEDAAKAMPPPPNPPPAMRILEPEMKALSSCLQNATVKAGQIYKFYHNVEKLGVQQYSPGPPRVLSASLGREIEKYDQLCDAIEAQLLRAITVLQRDLSREQRRIREAEAATVISPVVSAPPTSTTSEPMDAAPPTSASTPRPSPSGSSNNPMSRRPSNISISSLHRAPFPLKIDLPSPSLRMSQDDMSAFSGKLASPINLNSSQALGPPEFNAEIMAAFASAAPDGVDRTVDIDLTTDDVEVGGQELITMGNTADKPIELDLDSMDIDIASMTDLFGDTTEPSNDGDAFSADAVLPDRPVKSEEDLDIQILDAFTSGSADHDDIFGLAGSDSGDLPGVKPPPPDAQLSHAQSPGSMLASFEAAANLGSLDSQPTANSQNLNIPDGGFEFLGPEYFSNTQDPGSSSTMDFQQLLSTMGNSLDTGDTATQNEEPNKQ